MFGILAGIALIIVSFGILAVCLGLGDFFEAKANMSRLFDEEQDT